jgi:amino acid transporter
LLVFLTLLYTWTAYSATIGVGWQQAGSVLGNVNAAPQQYVTLAGAFVGRWLGIALVVFVLTSNVASAFAMHQAMVRYGYSLGREGILPRIFGKTHPRWKSPYLASLAQSSLSLLVILLLSLVIEHTNKDGSVIYALGFAQAPGWQQAGGITAFGWLASIVTMCIIIVYILTNLAAPCFAHRRKELRLFPHIVAPTMSTLMLLLPLASYVLVPLPLIGSVVTQLGFAPTPFPANILPLFVLAWALVGQLYAAMLAWRAPERDARLGLIFGDGQGDTHVASLREMSQEE